MSRFGIWVQPGTQPAVEAWGELCMSTVPDLQACVLRIMQEHPGAPLILDLRRVWFCDLAGLRSLWWLMEHGECTGTQIDVRASEAVARIGRLVHDLRAARIA